MSSFLLNLILFLLSLLTLSLALLSPTAGNTATTQFELPPSHKGTISFTIAPLHQQQKHYELALEPVFKLKITDRGAELLVVGQATSSIRYNYSKVVVKQPEHKLLHFNASDKTLWISFFDRHAPDNSFIKIGEGYRTESNTLAVFRGRDDIFSAALGKVKRVVLNDSATRHFRTHFDSRPVVIDLSPAVVAPNSNLESLSEVIVPSEIYPKFPTAAETLYGKVSGQTISAKDAAAINFSLDQDGCTLNKILRSKKSLGSSSKTSYIRATSGQDTGTSPGVPFVYEIWPKYHSSPVHDHGNSVGIIKVLHGSVVSEWYNPLPEASYELPVAYRSNKFHAGQVTWLSPELYQTHRIWNDRRDTAAITLQSYATPSRAEATTDGVFSEDSFRYVNAAKMPNISYFTPNSDIEYAQLLIAVRREFCDQRCLARRSEARDVVVEKGETGNCVKYVQGALNMSVTGSFDEDTEAAVSRYQRQQGVLPADGIVDGRTWNFLPGMPRVAEFEQ